MTAGLPKPTMKKLSESFLINLLAELLLEIEQFGFLFNLRQSQLFEML